MNEARASGGELAEYMKLNGYVIPLVPKSELMKKKRLLERQFVQISTTSCPVKYANEPLAAELAHVQAGHYTGKCKTVSYW